MKYIYPIDNFIVDTDILVSEYEQVIHHRKRGKINPYVKIVVQNLFRLYRNNVWTIDSISTIMPYTNSIINQVATIYDFNTIFYRELAPCCNYRWHSDPERECYHIPLKVNMGCFFMYEDINYRMPIDRLYRVDNGMPHTFVNAGDTPRLHLMFEKRKNKGLNK